jgi:protein-disulfide isomerase
LKKNYIDTGKVLYVARDYVYETGTSQGAFRAAIAANCAREQGKYWEMRDLLFENTKHFSPATLSIHAKALGLDMTKFRYCLDDGYRQEVSDDYQDGKAAGMKAGTLAYYVNGFKVLTSSFDQLNVTIDNVLTGKWS